MPRVGVVQAMWWPSSYGQILGGVWVLLWAWSRPLVGGRWHLCSKVSADVAYVLTHIATHIHVTGYLGHVSSIGTGPHNLPMLSSSRTNMSRSFSNYSALLWNYSVALSKYIVFGRLIELFGCNGRPPPTHPTHTHPPAHLPPTSQHPQQPLPTHRPPTPITHSGSSPLPTTHHPCQAWVLFGSHSL